MNIHKLALALHAFFVGFQGSMFVHAVKTDNTLLGVISAFFIVWSAFFVRRHFNLAFKE